MRPTTITKPFLITAIGFLSLVLIGASTAMSSIGIKLPLSGAWKERFQDVAKLNDYAKNQPVEIANATIKDYNIDGAVLKGGRFENTHWKDVSAKQVNLTKTVFSKGVLENVDFSDSVLTDVVFEDMMLWEVRFYSPTLNNVRFIRCTFNGSNVDRTKASRIEVSDSRVVSSSFSEGQLVAVFRNSKLEKGTELTDLVPPSSLTFEKSELTDLDMDRSKLNELVIDGSNFDGGLQLGSIESLSIRNSIVDATFSATTIGRLTISNADISRMEFIRTKINSMLLENCKRSNDFNMFQVTASTIDITRCPLNEFSPISSNIGGLRVKDSSIGNSEFQKMKAKTVTLENVSLDGEINFTGAQLGELKTHNITKQPGLNLITTDSNVRF